MTAAAAPLADFCASVPGYALARGWDSGGADILQDDRLGPLQLAALCEDTPGCVAFTSRGALKSAVKPQLDPWPSPGPCDGLFTRQPAAAVPDCPPGAKTCSYCSADGRSRTCVASALGAACKVRALKPPQGCHAQALHPAASAKRCASAHACSRLPQAGGTTLRSCSDWLPRNPNPLAKNECPGLPGAIPSTKAGALIPWWVDLKALAPTSFYCSGVLGLDVRRRGRGAAQPVAATVAQSAAQIPGAELALPAEWCNAPAGYALVPAKDSWGGNIGQQLSSLPPASLAVLCDGTAGCVAFTTTGWLKSAVKPQLDPPAAACQGLFLRNGEPGWCAVWPQQAGHPLHAPLTGTVLLRAAADCSKEPSSTLCNYCGPDGSRRSCVWQGRPCKVGAPGRRADTLGGLGRVS